MELTKKLMWHTAIAVGVMLLLGTTAGYSQVNDDYTRVNGKLIVQVSGVVVEQGTNVPLMGVHIYVPKYGRGTTSDRNGFFSDVFLEGDSVLVSAVGFQNQWLVISPERDDRLTLVIELSEDATYLSEVEVLPYPTERQLRQTVLAMSDPNVQQQIALARSMSPETMVALMQLTPMNGSENYTYYQNQQFYNASQGPVRGNPLLNPFAWNELIRSIKRGDFKKD